MKKISFKSEKQKDVMTYFGAAMYFAQGIENTINFMCCMKKFEKAQGDYLSDYENYRKKLKAMTLGKLINELARVCPEIYKKIPKDEFIKAKEIRDFLAHKVFRDGLEFDLLSNKEDEMSDLLVDHAFSLKKFDTSLTMVLDELSNQLEGKIIKEIMGQEI